MSEKPWMIYGANGYTGELIAREARRRGLSPILAGRNREAISSLAQDLGFAARIFSLADPARVVENLRQVDLVLHCAGPFSATSEPMVNACLAARTHYLDITGEIGVFEAVHARHEQAVNRGILLMPGCGFDVVPTDCLALTLKERLPDADRLILAFHTQGRPSQGTAKTTVEGLKLGGRVRMNGEIRSVPIAYRVREVDFNGETRLAATIPWGDVSTAYYTTGIPNIEVYMAFTATQIRMLKRLRRFRWFLARERVQRWLKARAAAACGRGPNESQRAQTRAVIWGQVRNARGQRVDGLLITPNGYEVTVQASLGIVTYLLAYPVEPGFHTPAKLMGERFIRTLPGVELQLPYLLKRGAASETPG